MATLTEELKADQDPRTQCRFCSWLEDWPKPELVEWATAMIDRSYTHASLYRAAQRRGFTAGKGTVEGHRTNGHKP